MIGESHDLPLLALSPPREAWGGESYCTWLLYLYLLTILPVLKLRDAGNPAFACQK